LNHIEEECPSDASLFKYTASCARSDPSRPKGEVALEIRRCKTFAGEKKDRIKRKISQLVDWMTRFNQDYLNSDEPDSMAITANIQCYGNVSLLHAAIELCDENLVEKLIALGANPLGRSKVGSAMSRALKLKDRAEEKWEHKKLSSDEVDMLAQKKVLDSFTRILEVMRQNIVDPRVPQKYSFVENGSEDSLDRFHERNSGPLTGSSHNSWTEKEPDVADDTMTKRPAWGGGRLDRAASADAELPKHSDKLNDYTPETRSSHRPSLEGDSSQTSTAPPSRRPSWGAPRPSLEGGSSQPSTRPPSRRPSWGAPAGLEQHEGQSEVVEGSTTKTSSWSLGQGAQAISAGAEPPKSTRWDMRSASSLERGSSRRPSWEGKNSQASTSFPSRRPSLGHPAGSDHMGQSDAVEGSATRRPSWKSTQNAGNCVSSNRAGWVGARDSAYASLDTQPPDWSSGTTSGNLYLPQLSQEWLDTGRLARCRKGDSPGACWHGTQGKCRFWHVEPFIRGPIPDDSVDRSKLKIKNVTIKEHSGWFTAAYTNHNNKKIIYVQGGREARVSDRGVYYYPTEAAATAALEVVVALTKRRYR
jgi:hypothetical protein